MRFLEHVKLYDNLKTKSPPLPLLVVPTASLIEPAFPPEMLLPDSILIEPEFPNVDDGETILITPLDAILLLPEESNKLPPFPVMDVPPNNHTEKLVSKYDTKSKH